MTKEETLLTVEPYRTSQINENVFLQQQSGTVINVFANELLVCGLECKINKISNKLALSKKYYAPGDSQQEAVTLRSTTTELVVKRLDLFAKKKKKKTEEEEINLDDLEDIGEDEPALRDYTCPDCKAKSCLRVEIVGRSRVHVEGHDVCQLYDAMVMPSSSLGRNDASLPLLSSSSFSSAVPVPSSSSSSSSSSSVSPSLPASKRPRTEANTSENQKSEHGKRRRKEANGSGRR